MARLPRYYIPDCPYHITQRGNDGQPVFRDEKDRRVYLQLVRETARQSGVRLLAFCLMTNHVHFIAVPTREDSLATWLRRTQGRYAQYFNFAHGHSGHLWQSRYFACALEEAHLWRALRYVERNPVRAGLAPHASEYRWSSATAHLSGEDEFDLLDLTYLRRYKDEVSEPSWADLLREPDDASFVQQLQRHTYAGRPCGSPGFLNEVEQLTGRKLPAMYQIQSGISSASISCPASSF